MESDALGMIVLGTITGLLVYAIVGKYDKDKWQE